MGSKCWSMYDDANPPPPPVVTSAKYPHDAAERDDVGQPGAFNIAPAPGSERIVKSPGCTATQCTLTKTSDAKGEWQLTVGDRPDRSRR
jgi:hypothetical protein